MTSNQVEGNKMKTTKLLIIALVFGAMAASSAMAQTVTRTSARTSINSSRPAASNWNHHRYYRPRSSFSFGIGLGYPYYGYGYGNPYYGGYPYYYGYYTPRTTVYATSGLNDDATLAPLPRPLPPGGYFYRPLDVG